MEEAILGIQESAAAAEASEALKQQALDDSAAAETAETAAEQLQEENRYALSEAEAAEKVAEELSSEGRTTESMTAAATAGRCTSPFHFFSMCLALMYQSFLRSPNSL